MVQVMAGLLIHNGYVLALDRDHTVYAPGWVWVQEDRIGDLGDGQPPAELVANAGRCLDATNMAVLPGMVNGHTHLSQTFVRGLADDKRLLDWLRGVIWPIQAAMTPEDVRLASLLGLVENLRCGVTSVVQHHKITTSPAHVDAASRLPVSLGNACSWRAAGWIWAPAPSRRRSSIAEVSRLRQEWHGAAEGRIMVGFGPMAPWRCSDETMRRTVTLGREWGIPTHLHVAEAQDEIDMLRQRTGKRHVEWLASLDALGPDVHLVHSVWVDDDELDLIAQAGAVVVHCPVSNMYLASGIAPLRKMLDRGIAVALGTDGPGSENSQDLLEALKIAALLAKVSSGDAMALLPFEALRMATVDGARLLGRTDLGQLVPGAKADITLVNLNNARTMPVHRPESALVYNATGPDVHTVIVDGRILLDAGRLTMLDEESLLEECRLAARRLMARAGVAQG
jgi:5-methylthioadenosine/S-adenosylhomocysteine deaminase